MKPLLTIIALAALNLNAQTMVPMDARIWRIYHRDTRGERLARVAKGLQFTFSQSALPDPNAGPVWDGYLVANLITGQGKDWHGTPINGSTLVVRFNVTASAGTIWNFKSETSNNGTTPASVRIYMQAGPLYSTNEDWRWWSNPASFQLANANGKSLDVTFRIPFDAANWSDTYGHRPDRDEQHVKGFAFVRSSCSYIGFTFGGGSFFGHGVNVTGGNATFTVTEVRTE
jgi:hypothetical protein